MNCIITVNIPTSITAALHMGRKPFITIPCAEKVSAMARKRRSPVCCW